MKGVVGAVDAAAALIEVGGVGYEVRMPSADLSRLHGGSEAHVYTYLNVSQDAITLYGFLEPAAKRTFLQLLKVSGIGPKVALSLLSTLNPSQLAKAVSDNDAAALAKAPGLGRKGAQKIILELKGSIDLESLEESGAAVTTAQPEDKGALQVVEGLMSLGWRQQDAEQAVHAACEANGIATPVSAENVPIVLKLALASLDRGV
nr:MULTISPECIES: Holliday junction branch migration protein RuvA [Bifidobacterium]